MENKYRIWCVTENNWVETDWINEPPTECPNDSLHTVDTTNTTIIDSLSGNNILISIGGNSGEYYYETDTNVWEVVRKFYFKGIEVMGAIKSCSITACCDDPNKPAQYRIYDITNDAYISEWNNINTIEFEVYENPGPATAPEGSAVFELQGKGFGSLSGEHSKVSSLFIEFY